MEKFTVIYTDSWMSGSNMHTLTKMRRIKKHENETMLDALYREGIAECAVFIFHDHPLLQGE